MADLIPIRGAEVLPPRRGVLDVLIAGNRVAALGKNLESPPSSCSCEVIDAHGLRLTPGSSMPTPICLVVAGKPVCSNKGTGSSPRASPPQVSPQPSDYRVPMEPPVQSQNFSPLRGDWASWDSTHFATPVATTSRPPHSPEAFVGISYMSTVLSRLANSPSATIEALSRPDEIIKIAAQAHTAGMMTGKAAWFTFTLAMVNGSIAYPRGTK